MFFVIFYKSLFCADGSISHSYGTRKPFCEIFFDFFDQSAFFRVRAFVIPVELSAALGYAAVFGGGTNTLLAAIFIGGEIFGYDYLPYFFIVCPAAYVFNRNSSIYSRQKLTKYSC